MSNKSNAGSVVYHAQKIEAEMIALIDAVSVGETGKVKRLRRSFMDRLRVKEGVLLVPKEELAAAIAAAPSFAL